MPNITGQSAPLAVASLNIYPIKSCAGIALDVAEIGPRGFQYDRAVMLTTPQGRFLTQREQPRMALIRPAIQGDGTLAVVAPGMSELTLSIADTGAHCQVVIWKSNCVAIDQGEEVADWFSTYLGIPCRLVAMAREHMRKVNPDYAVAEHDQVSFADGYPFMLLSLASLDDLNTRLQQPLPMNRFRPNIVVSGSAPYEEDTWRTIRIGQTVFHVVKPCARCPIPTTDQDTTIRGKEPLRTLATYRHAPQGVVFGQNLIHEQTGTIRVGDVIEVLEKASTPNFTLKTK
ncbi:MAG TPA: MOSC N-terminal beta barrel domain-containing protein [Ktedonobacterales bacterium]|nr:MOSC N-terminal beta barrel domain-containing protein [Ktedonobacterales bacterium]